jgi:hypothetical protein
MDEDFARLLGSQDGRDEKDNGVFRRVSNAVSKHGRSFSDRGSVTSRGHKKWPTNGSIDISSPTVASPDTKEEGVNLRNELCVLAQIGFLVRRHASHESQQAVEIEVGYVDSDCAGVVYERKHLIADLAACED